MYDPIKSTEPNSQTQTTPKGSLQVASTEQMWPVDDIQKFKFKDKLGNGKLSTDYFNKWCNHFNEGF